LKDVKFEYYLDRKAKIMIDDDPQDWTKDKIACKELLKILWRVHPEKAVAL